MDNLAESVIASFRRIVYNVGYDGFFLYLKEFMEGEIEPVDDDAAKEALGEIAVLMAEALDVAAYVESRLKLSRLHTIALPENLDLSPTEFKVAVHIMANRKVRANAGAIAVHCRMGEDAANQVLDMLKKRGLVEVIEEEGRPYLVASMALLRASLNRIWKSANGDSR